MKRKVVLQGNATLMVSLPSVWAKKYFIRKGDELLVEQVDASLIISKTQSFIKRDIEVNISGYSEPIVRAILLNLYRTGYNRITILHSSQFPQIVAILQKYILGFEIIEQEKAFCVIENITEPSEDQYEVLLRKIFYNISLLLKNTKDRLMGTLAFEEYTSSVATIYHYDNFCRRVIHKRQMKNSSSMLMFLKMIMQAHGELYYLNQYLDTHKVKFSHTEFYTGVQEMFTMLTNAFIDKDIKKLDLVSKMDKHLVYDSYYSILENKKSTVVLHHLLLFVKNLNWAISPLAAIILTE